MWETSPREKERIEWVVAALEDKYAKTRLHVRRVHGGPIETFESYEAYERVYPDNRTEEAKKADPENLRECCCAAINCCHSE